jgi:hypothetical protein
MEYYDLHDCDSYLCKSESYGKRKIFCSCGVASAFLLHQLVWDECTLLFYNPPVASHTDSCRQGRYCPANTPSVSTLQSCVSIHILSTYTTLWQNQIRPNSSPSAPRSGLHSVPSLDFSPSSAFWAVSKRGVFLVQTPVTAFQKVDHSKSMCESLCEIQRLEGFLAKPLLKSEPQCAKSFGTFSNV